MPVWHKLLIQAACFALVYVPTVAVFQHLQAKHDLIGQVPLVTYYAGEHFASNTRALEPDSEGYAESVKRFGGPEIYHNSLIRFAVAQPAAVLTRITQNIGNTITLFESGDVLRPADWLLLVIFGALLAQSTRAPISGRLLLLYAALLSAASTYFLFFHVDPRYPLAFVLTLLVWVQIVAILLWQRIGRRFTSVITPGVRVACTLLLVGLFVVRTNAAVATARLTEFDVMPFYVIAETFRSGIGPSGTPPVSFDPPIMDAMWISYFANTSIPWHVESAVFPRDRIYSFKNRAEEYMLVPASTNLHDLGNPPILWRYTFPSIGEYICLDLRRGGSTGR